MATIEQLFERFASVFRIIEDEALQAHIDGNPDNRPPIPSLPEKMWRTAERLIDDLDNNEQELAELIEGVRAQLIRGTGMLSVKNQERIIELLKAPSREECKAALIMFFGTWTPGR